MDYKDYYATLGVGKTASKDEIQKAYRKLARKYHPDVNTAEGAEDRFKEITEAYEVLKDQEKRQTYDQFGSNWKHAGSGAGGVPPGWQNVQFDFGGGGGSGFSSFFDMLFGGGRGAPGQAGRGGDPFAGFAGGGGSPPYGFDPAVAAGGRDLEMTLALTLEEAAAGGRRDITARDPNSGENLSFSVNLPPGVRQGQKIRLAGKGAAGANGQNGDLYLKVDFRPHPRFELDGHDLHVDLPVSPWHAALGGEASIKTLQGTLRVKVPPGSSTGRRIRLRGKGYPNPKGQDGDLYAKLKIMVPEKLTERESALFEQLADESSFKPR